MTDFLLPENDISNYAKCQTDVIWTMDSCKLYYKAGTIELQIVVTRNDGIYKTQNNSSCY